MMAEQRDRSQRARWTARALFLLAWLAVGLEMLFWNSNSSFVCPKAHAVEVSSSSAERSFSPASTHSPGPRDAAPKLEAASDGQTPLASDTLFLDPSTTSTDEGSAEERFQELEEDEFEHSTSGTAQHSPREDIAVPQDGSESPFTAFISESEPGEESFEPSTRIPREPTEETPAAFSFLQVNAAAALAKGQISPSRIELAKGLAAAALAKGQISPSRIELAKGLAAAPAAPAQKETATQGTRAGRHLLSSTLSSVVKIFVDFTLPDYYSPWQMQAPKEASGSGFVVEGKRILTNGHVVAETTRVLVRKHGNAKKFLARVLATAHEADLALLEVDSEEFWENLQPLPFGGIPRLRDSVTVLGYPTGGDQLSITEGIVSRVGMSAYAHSSVSLLTVQIDAAINPGNSGGPAVVDGRVVGVAFQGFSQLQNVGYIVPYPIVRHFLNDLVLHGRYTGFPSLGVKIAHMENDHLRQFKGLSALTAADLPPGVTPTGVLVVEVDNLRVSRYKTGQIRVPYASRSLAEPRDRLELLQELRAQDEESAPPAAEARTSELGAAESGGQMDAPRFELVSAASAASGDVQSLAHREADGGLAHPAFLQTRITPTHILGSRSQLLRLYALARRRQQVHEVTEGAASPSEGRELVATGHGDRSTPPPIVVNMTVAKLGPGLYAQIPKGAFGPPVIPVSRRLPGIRDWRLQSAPDSAARGENPGVAKDTGHVLEAQEHAQDQAHDEVASGRNALEVQENRVVRGNARGALPNGSPSPTSSEAPNQQTARKAVEPLEEGPRSEEELLLPNPYFPPEQDVEGGELGLKVGDVILAVDGTDVADDGTVAFRQLERVSIDYTIMNRFNGETCKVLVLRDGRVREILVPITNLNLKIPRHTWDQKPKYFVFGGLVFTTLTRQLLEHMKAAEFPAHFYTKIKRSEYQEAEGDEVVVLSVILASELTVGYNAAPAIVTAVQGQKVRGLADVVRIVEESKENFLEFTVKVSGISQMPIVLDRQKAMAVNPKILGQHKILRDRSFFL